MSTDPRDILLRLRTEVAHNGRGVTLSPEDTRLALKYIGALHEKLDENPDWSLDEHEALCSDVAEQEAIHRKREAP